MVWESVLRIRIRFYGSRSRNYFPIRIRFPAPGKKTQIFSKAITKFWEKILFSIQKVGILFLFSTNQVGTVFCQKGNFYLVSFLKISEIHEKFVEKVDFNSSILLPGSGFRIRIRIQPGDLNQDPPGSRSVTLVFTF